MSTSNESNMLAANDMLTYFLWLHKAIGLSGLAKYAKISKSELRVIQYKDENKLSTGKLDNLITGLNSLRDYINKEYDVMIDKLMRAKNEQ